MHMKIVKGRGNNRKTVLAFPSADVVARSTDAEKKAARTLLCNVLEVPLEGETTEPESALA